MDPQIPQFVLTDGVVVWRAWVICRDEYRKLLTAPIVMLVLTMCMSFLNFIV